MGRSAMQRQAEIAARIQKYESVLRAPRLADTSEGLATIAARVAYLAPSRVLRSPDTFNGRLKSKDPGKLTLALAKHVYASFPAPRHLERFWLSPAAVRQREQMTTSSPPDPFDRFDWWLAVAQGKSLHKECTCGFFSRKETHAFLTAVGVNTFEEALWYAVARSFTDEHGLALRIARSRLNERRPDVPFWKEAARFFVVNRVELDEIGDLLDYLGVRLAENRGFSLKGRTLGSLRNQMHAWHRDLTRLKKIGRQRWDGFTDIETWSYEAKGENPDVVVVWTFSEIRESVELQKEGNAMRHCVLSYRDRCVAGRCAIFTVRRRVRGGEERALTIEVNSERNVVQVRGFANRRPTPHEDMIVKRWARAKGLSY